MTRGEMPVFYFFPVYRFLNTLLILLSGVFGVFEAPSKRSWTICYFLVLLVHSKSQFRYFIAPVYFSAQSFVMN